MFTCDIQGTHCTPRRKLRNKEIIKEQQPCKKSFSHGKRPKVRELAQHGSQPDWLEESDPAGVILYVMDGRYCLLFLYRTDCLDRRCLAAS